MAKSKQSVELILNSKQELAIELPTKRLLLSGGVRCFVKDTKILMFNGSIKSIQDIVIGDLVMGPDSKPRYVSSTHNGLDDTYTVCPNKFESYTVNSEHILCLKSNGRLGKRKPNSQKRIIDKTIRYTDISVNDYIKSSGKFKYWNKVYKVSVDFQEKDLHIDPYFLGLWLGDGHSKTIGLTNIDTNVIDYFTEYVINSGLKIRKSGISYFAHGYGKTGGNTLLNQFKQLNLINNKHIPNDYLINSRENRLKLLAGLIDTDGYVEPSGKHMEISQKNKTLAYQIMFLVQSLGLHCSIREEYKTCQTGNGGFYQRLYIGGDCSIIPTLIKRKQAPLKKTHKSDGKRVDNPLMTGFKVIPTGLKEIVYGFECDRDKKFLLADFQVVHNSGKTMASCLKVREIALRMPGSQILVVRKTLKELRDDTFKVFYNPIDGLLANVKLYGAMNKSNYEHNLPNGSKIYYRSADDEKKWLGMDLSCIYFEQAENIEKKYFDYALTRLTFWGDNKNEQSRGYRYIQKYNNDEYGGVIAKKPNHFFIMSCNPDCGSWIYDDIISTCPGYTHFTPHVKHPELGWDIINFQTEDNIQLPDVKKYIEEIKLTASDTHYRRMILGEWTGSEGMIFSHFINQMHIKSDFTYNSDIHEIVVGIDPGSVWFTGVIFGAYNKKTEKFIVFDEIKVRNVIIPEIAILIREKLAGYKINIEKVIFLIDAAANIKESQGISKADQYKQCKIYVQNANKVLDGALERINGFFKQNKIEIVGNCVNLLNDIKSYKYDKDGKPNKKAGAMGFDLVDAFRYFINHYAYPAKFKEQRPVVTDTTIRTKAFLTNMFMEVGNEKQDDPKDYWGV